MSTVYHFPHLHKLSLLLEAMKNCAIQYYVKKKTSFNVAGLKSIRNDKKILFRKYLAYKSKTFEMERQNLCKKYLSGKLNNQYFASFIKSLLF